MKVLGIITEYNPFHNGHLLHINKAKELTGAELVIAVMSGNYVMRGEPAIVGKKARALMAIENGVDLVLELPVYYATRSAEFFAYGAVSMLEACGIVTHMCFGSELGRLEPLAEVAEILANEPPEFKEELKIQLKKGLSYPAAREAALSAFTAAEPDVLKNPNNILGIEYLKALIRLNSSIMPCTLKRTLSQYNSLEINGSNASALAIRKAVFENKLSEVKAVMPFSAFEIFKKELEGRGGPCCLDRLSQILHYVIATKSKEQLSCILDVNEGLENRIVKMAEANFLISEIIQNVKTKRFTYTAIQRAILHITLGLNKEDFANSVLPPYLRVLGFSPRGRLLLSEIAKNASSPLLTNLRNVETKLNHLGIKFLEKENEVDRIYNILKSGGFKI